ncbi:hypothetical protein [Frankia sp. Mgl5]|nr:hypothetical protein [Frankia sp. Mgl5]
MDSKDVRPSRPAAPRVAGLDAALAMPTPERPYLDLVRLART